MHDHRQRVAAGIARVCLLLGLAVGLLPHVVAGPVDPGPEVDVPLTQSPPLVDGILDDACWETALQVTDFWNSGTQEAPTQETVGYVCRDAANLYFAFRCGDTEPEEIRAFQNKRDGTMHRDDTVGVLIDARNERRAGWNYYEFTVNPLGTQATEVPGGSATKVEWAGDWEGAAQIVADGWVAEFAIPYAILRYPAGQQDMGLILTRSIERNEERLAWPPMKPRWDPFLAAEMVNLNPPTPVSRPVFMPWMQFEINEDNAKLDAGFDAKYQFGNGLCTTFTAFPNYSNIQDEILGIDFTYTERRQRETRPFFREGGGYFPHDTAFYSRRIEEFDFGTKVFGEVGDTRLGALLTTWRGAQNHAVMNVEQRLGPYSSAALAYVYRDDDNVRNGTARGNLSWRKPIGEGELNFTSSYYRTSTHGAPGGDDDSAYAELWRSYGNGKPYFSLGYRDVGPEYTPLVAYVPEQDLRGAWCRGGISWRSSHTEIERKWIGFRLEDYDHHDGSPFSRQFGTEGGIRTSSGYGLSLGYMTGDRPPFSDHTFRVSAGWGRNSLDEEGEVSVVVGHRGGARYRFVSVEQGFKYADRLRMQVRGQYSRRSFFATADPDEKDYQAILSGTYDLTNEKSVSTRTVLTDDGLNVYFAYRQVVRRGMDLYVILGDPNADKTRARLAVQSVWTH